MKKESYKKYVWRWKCDKVKSLTCIWKAIGKSLILLYPLRRFEKTGVSSRAAGMESLPSQLKSK